MRKFSDELIQDREFEIGGELFEWIYPHWEVGAKIFDGDLEPAKNGDGEDIGFWLKDAKFAVERVPMFLHPKNDSHKRWKALCARKTDAVPRHQIAQLYTWLVQVTGNLPTTPPSSEPSADGAGETEAVSSAVSPSTEETSTA